jgi:hypothetical protein
MKWGTGDRCEACGVALRPSETKICRRCIRAIELALMQGDLGLALVEPRPARQKEEKYAR